MGKENPTIRYILNRLTASPNALKTYQHTEGMFHQNNEDPDKMTDDNLNFKARKAHYASFEDTKKKVTPLTGRLSHDLSTLGIIKFI